MRSAAKVRQGAAPAGRPEPACAKKRHICFVAPHAWPALSRDPHIPEVGGAEVQQAALARLLAARGHRVSMICLDYGQPGGARVDGVTVHKAFRRDAGIPVLRFAHPRLTSMWRAMAAADAELYYFRSASMWVAVLAAFCRRHGRRAIYAAASDRDFVPGHAGQIRYARDRWLYRRGIAAVDAIVAQNETQRAQCTAHFGREARVIASCYQLPPGARPAGGEDILWVGTMHLNKRPELALELARRLPHRRFVMIGGPSPDGRETYETARARAASLPNVQFTGFLPIDAVERRFDGARVLINTSAYEGMPNTFLQAWARGVPTLATVDVGTPVNRVFHDLDEGAAELERLAGDAQHWARASQAVREHFESNHSSAEVMARYEAIFDQLLG